MKLWAVVIGKKGPKRYVAYSYYHQSLAVFRFKNEARDEKLRLIHAEGHEDIYVIPFESK